MPNLENVKDLLEPLRTITHILCTASSPTISLVLPFKTKILEAMAVKDDDSRLIKDMKSAIANDLQKR
jgi:hypothetical protein